MKETTKEPIKLRTYNSIWKMERMIYSFQEFELPVPISFKQLGYWGGTLVAIYIIDTLPFMSFIHNMFSKIPLISLIDHWSIRYLVFPVFLSWFVTNKKLDGKLPHKFIYGAIRYLNSPKKSNRYKVVNDKDVVHKYSGVVSYRKLSYRNEEEKNEL